MANFQSQQQLERLMAYERERIESLANEVELQERLSQALCERTSSHP